MKLNRSNVLSFILLFLILANIIIQVLLYIVTRGINSILLSSELIVSCILLYKLIASLKLNRKISKISMFVITVLTLFLCFITIEFSPRYTYSQAETIISQRYSNIMPLNVIDLEIVTMSTTIPYNFFVSKGYLIGVENESEVSYFLVDPYDGSITKIEFSHIDYWIVSINWTEKIRAYMILILSRKGL